eukprot:Skav235834  [mRNA]  locus=scaffold1931:253689:256967:- [translate_table: standard]
MLEDESTEPRSKTEDRKTGGRASSNVRKAVRAVADESEEVKAEKEDETWSKRGETLPVAAAVAGQCLALGAVGFAFVVPTATPGATVASNGALRGSWQRNARDMGQILAQLA